MPRMKRDTVVVSMFMLMAVIISACELPYSTPPAGTSTPISATSLFETPIEQTPEITMSEIAGFGTQTALALTGTPIVVIETPTPEITDATPTLDLSVTDTSTTPFPTSGAETAAPPTSGALPTSAPVGSRPATYTLKPGEFPYCLARRFDVDPDELLRVNGLSGGNIYYPNLTLQIPQSGSFPGTRALRNHPTTYTVTGANQSVYAVACLFGDVDPAAIAQANNISVDATLTSGQQLNIP